MPEDIGGPSASFPDCAVVSDSLFVNGWTEAAPNKEQVTEIYC